MEHGTSTRLPSRAVLMRLFAISSVAVYLVPEGAHFFEMFSKLKLAPQDYIIAQRLYDGWALFGIVIVLALAGTLGLAVATWRTPPARWPSLAAFAALAGTQAIFWSFIYPMNALTLNWTTMPADLEAARRQWEFAHAINAGLTFAALILVTWAALLGTQQEIRSRTAGHQ